MILPSVTSSLSVLGSQSSDCSVNLGPCIFFHQLAALLFHQKDQIERSVPKTILSPCSSLPQSLHIIRFMMICSCSSSDTNDDFCMFYSSDSSSPHQIHITYSCIRLLVLVTPHSQTLFAQTMGLSAIDKKSASYRFR